MPFWRVSSLSASTNKCNASFGLFWYLIWFEFVEFTQPPPSPRIFILHFDKFCKRRKFSPLFPKMYLVNKYFSLFIIYILWVTLGGLYPWGGVYSSSNWINSAINWFFCFINFSLFLISLVFILWPLLGSYIGSGEGERKSLSLSVSSSIKFPVLIFFSISANLLFLNKFSNVIISIFLGIEVTGGGVNTLSSSELHFAFFKLFLSNIWIFLYWFKIKSNSKSWDQYVFLPFK